MRALLRKLLRRERQVTPPAEAQGEARHLTLQELEARKAPTVGWGCYPPK